MIRRPQKSPLFPTTPLFRSMADQAVSDGTLSQAEADDAVRAVQEAAEAGHAFSAVAMFGFLLRKPDRKSTRLNSSHANISYAVFCLKKKNNSACHNTSHSIR